MHTQTHKRTHSCILTERLTRLRTLTHLLVAGWVGKAVDSAKCLHHTLMLADKDVRKSCHKEITKDIGAARDKKMGEFATSNVVDSIQIQLGKEFGHLNPYAFGHGGVDFPTWMKQKYPGHYVGMDRIVGNRSMVFSRNALVHNYMAPYYLEFLDNIVEGVGEYNRLQLKTMTKIGCEEVLTSLKCRALIFVYVLHPFLILSQSAKIAGPEDKGKAIFLDQGPFIRRALEAAQHLTRDPSPLFNPNWNILEGMDSSHMCVNVQREHLRWSEKKKWKLLTGVLFNELEEQEWRDRCLSVLRSHCAAL